MRITRPLTLLAAACLLCWAATPAPTLAGDCHHCWSDPGDGYQGLAGPPCGSSFLTCGQGVYENPWDVHAHLWDGYCAGCCQTGTSRPVLFCKGHGILKTLLPARGACPPAECEACAAQAAAPSGGPTTNGQPSDGKPLLPSPMPSAPAISPRPVSAPTTSADAPTGPM